MRAAFHCWPHPGLGWPECRVGDVRQTQRKIEEGTATAHDVIQKGVCVTPALSVAMHHARKLIDDEGKELRWHMCHPNNPLHTSFQQVVQAGHHCGMFVKTFHSAPSDATHESACDTSGKLAGWRLLWA